MTWICLRYAEDLVRLISVNGVGALNRILGLLILAIGVALVAQGVKSMLLPLKNGRGTSAYNNLYHRGQLVYRAGIFGNRVKPFALRKVFPCIVSYVFPASPASYLSCTPNPSPCAAATFLSSANARQLRFSRKRLCEKGKAAAWPELSENLNPSGKDRAGMGRAKIDRVLLRTVNFETQTAGNHGPRAI